MSFRMGNKLAGSRKGVPNKRSEQAKAIIDDAGYCPITGLMEAIKIAFEKFIEEGKKLESGRMSPMESSQVQYLKIICDANHDLAGYLYPKLKAVERSNVSPLADMTPEQKLEAMRQAVKLLEAETKK